MGLGIDKLFLMFLVLQRQYDRFMIDRPALMEEIDLSQARRIQRYPGLQYDRFMTDRPTLMRENNSSQARRIHRYPGPQRQYDRFMTDRPTLMRENNSSQARRIHRYPGLQRQYDRFMTDRPTLRENNPSQARRIQRHRVGAVLHDSDDMDVLTEIDSQLAVLEENLRITLASILRDVSQMSRRQLWRQVSALQAKLGRLQASVRATIQNVRGRSTKEALKPVFSRSMLDLDNQKDEVILRDRPRFLSFHDLTQLEDLDYDFVRKCKSMNQSIEFKASMEGILKITERNLKTLQQMYINKWSNSLPSSYQSTARDTARSATNHSSEQTDPGNNPSQARRIQRHREEAVLLDSDDMDEENNPSQARRIHRYQGLLRQYDRFMTDRPTLMRNVTRISHDGTSAQGVSDSPTVSNSMHEVAPKTATKTQHNGSQPFHVVDMNTVILKTMVAICVNILCFL